MTDRLKCGACRMLRMQMGAEPLECEKCSGIFCDKDCLESPDHECWRAKVDLLAACDAVDVEEHGITVKVDNKDE